MNMIENAKANARRKFPRLYEHWVKWQRRRLPEQVSQILASKEPYKNYGEAVFDRLQQVYGQLWGEYGFDKYSTWRRGVERVLHLSEMPAFRGRRNLEVMEAACGEGMTGDAFENAGHQVTLHDLADWRDERTKHLNFVAGNWSEPLPLAAESFDLICSWNSFEHIESPNTALAELKRLCKKGGYIYLDFAPLWCSPLGLHALTFHMPYPQFLFSEEMIEIKMKEHAPRAPTPIAQEGAWTDQKKHMDLMNKWRIHDFRALWKKSGCELISLKETPVSSHINVIANYPRAFSGRGLSLEDVTVAAVAVLLRK